MLLNSLKGITRDQFLNAKNKTEFTGFYKDDYKNTHTHSSLERKPDPIN